MNLRSTTVNNEPIEELFGTRRSFAPFLRVSWTPRQYYRYEGRQKIYVRSNFPTFKLELSRSFQNILGSTSEFNRVELDISQNIPIGLMNSLQYHVGAGMFVNQKTEYFADFVYFSKNNFPWDDGLVETSIYEQGSLQRIRLIYSSPHDVQPILDTQSIGSSLISPIRNLPEHLYTPKLSLCGAWMRYRGPLSTRAFSHHFTRPSSDDRCTGAFEF